MNDLIISDLHYGDRRVNIDYLRDLINVSFPLSNIIMIGDVLDDWGNKNWDIEKFKSIFDKFNSIIIIRGNHDPENTQEILGDKFKVVDDYDLVLENKKYKLIHGHQYDDMFRKYYWFYRFTYLVNQWMVKTFKIDLQILKNFSLAKRNKTKYFKDIVKDTIKKMRIDFGNYNGVICGHTHYPLRMEYDGFEYINCGDFIDSYSYIKISDTKEVSLCGYFPKLNN